MDVKKGIVKTTALGVGLCSGFVAASALTVLAAPVVAANGTAIAVITKVGIWGISGATAVAATNYTEETLFGVASLMTGITFDKAAVEDALKAVS